MPNFILATTSNPLDSDSYFLTPGTPTCGITKNQICYIISADNGANQPIIDCTLKREITAALNTRTNGTRVFLKP